MSKKNIIKTIEIEIGSVTAKITPEEANALFDALKTLLGKDAPLVSAPVIIRERYPPYYPQPIWIGTSTTMSGGTNPHEKWTVNYSAESGTAKMQIQ